MDREVKKLADSLGVKFGTCPKPTRKETTINYLKHLARRLRIKGASNRK